MEFTNALLESLSLTQTSQTLASCRRFERESVEKIRRRLSHAHKIHKVETPEPASKEVNLVDHLRRNEKIVRSRVKWPIRRIVLNTFHVFRLFPLFK
ncbi:hypothetical protein HMI56_000014 [Coelomomyces lativittatus]|nr:hypothetical protein HMI56_000014 [Coelomomyces lativittatus]